MGSVESPRIVRLRALSAAAWLTASACTAGGSQSQQDAGTACNAGPCPSTDGDAGPLENAKCAPTTGGPHWLLEGETLRLRPRCEVGETRAASAFSFTGLPTNARYDEAAGELVFTPALNQAGVYSLGLCVAEIDECVRVKVGVADRWDDASNELVDPLSYTEEYGLPVLHLFTDPEIDGEAYRPARVVYRGHEFAGAEAKHRGASALKHPKKSFTLKFTRDDKFAEPKLVKEFDDRRKLTLVSSFDDNSYMRQRLAYALWERLDPEHIIIRTFHGVVFLDGVYQGLYLFADHVDGYLLEEHGYWQDGNLYKGRTHAADFRITDSEGERKESLHEGFTKEEGKPEPGEAGAYADLEALITWVATASDADLARELGTRLDQRDYEDWWIFVSLIMADDSAGKNSYHYHDPRPEAPDARFRFAPWDFNQSLGQDWRTRRNGHTRDPAGYALENGLFGRMLDSEGLGEALRARLGAALHGPFALDDVIGLIDTWAGSIDAAARRDEQKWSAAYRGYSYFRDRKDFTTYAEELVYLKQWIRDRWSWVDARY